ncbi:MAG: SPOR domain-containing protein [Gammaproteobacteria bacterium]|nr:SPOR domain-containing protein [Gammaproteobacteria bacterium]
MDIALKQRLVGASVLIALAVIVLPMLLGGRPESRIAESQKIELPPEPANLDFETRRYPIGEAPTAPPRQTAEPAPRPLPTPPPRQEPLEEATEPEQAASAADSDQRPAAPEDDRPVVVETPPQTSAPSASGTGRYVVQVASFGSLDNANRLSSTLGGYGYAVLLDSVKSDVGTLHRVRVGPFHSQADATGAVDRLKTQVKGVNPRVMDLRPELSAPVTTPSDPLVRWVVQVGSFSSRANAEKLVERLRQDGLSAFSEEVTSGSSRIHRVRIGPFLQRDEAIRVNGQAAERHSLEGVVMSVN